MYSVPAFIRVNDRRPNNEPTPDFVNRRHGDPYEIWGGVGCIGCDDFFENLFGDSMVRAMVK